METEAKAERRILRWVIVGVVFDLVVSVIVVILSILAINASSSAHIARVAAHENCTQANVSRAENKVLWGNVIALIPPSTPQAKAFDDKLMGLVNKTFEPRPCREG